MFTARRNLLSSVSAIVAIICLALPAAAQVNQPANPKPNTKPAAKKKAEDPPYVNQALDIIQRKAWNDAVTDALTRPPGYPTAQFPFAQPGNPLNPQPGLPGFNKPGKNTNEPLYIKNARDIIQRKAWNDAVVDALTRPAVAPFPQPMNPWAQPMNPWAQPMNPWAQPMIPWAQQPMNPWVQQPINPWAQQPMNPWVQQPINPWAQQPVNPWAQQPTNPWAQQPMNPWGVPFNPLNPPAAQPGLVGPWQQFPPLGFPGNPILNPQGVMPAAPGMFGPFAGF